MPPYRWNVAEHAQAYDEAAVHIHPYYLQMQAAIADLIPFDRNADFLVVDLGGGSGRLAELILQRFLGSRVVVLDQSTAFLDVAARRLAPFGRRVRLLCARLQVDWTYDLAEQPDVFVSMSAIHHLDHEEKQGLYERCYGAFGTTGTFINGDETRPASDEAYMHQCRDWAEHLRSIMVAGLVPDSMCEMLKQWEVRNVLNFHQPRSSGDDCHETAEEQVRGLHAAGFSRVDVVWGERMWAIIRGVKE